MYRKQSKREKDDKESDRINETERRGKDETY